MFEGQEYGKVYLYIHIMQQKGRMLRLRRISQEAKRTSRVFLHAGGRENL